MTDDATGGAIGTLTNPLTSRWTLAAAAACLLACTPNTEEVGAFDDSGGDTSTTTTTGGGSTSSDTVDPSATGTGGATTSTSGDAGTSTTTTDSGSDSDGTTTGVALGDFERFQMEFVAGPCPPEADCDGFVELLADGTLSVEEFGDITDTVVVAQVSAQDLADAIAVFTDPALVALLDDTEPPCVPPDDIFEQMTVEIDGMLFDNSTTACKNAQIVAARDMAMQLQDTYVP